MPPLRKILLLAANPENTHKLKLEQEIRTIKKIIQSSENRDLFEISSELGIRAEDLIPVLLCNPTIVHFLGHGSGEQGLILDDGEGGIRRVSAQALAQTFEQFPSVECVLLNACYSDEQAKPISHTVPHVIGMNKAISDRAAIAFSHGFYAALGGGRSYEAAYEMGITAIGNQDITEVNVPVWRMSSGKVINEQGSLEWRQEGNKPTLASNGSSSKGEQRDIGFIAEYPEDDGRPPSISENRLQQQSRMSDRELRREPGGTVRLSSKLYVERSEIDANCLTEIEQPGSLIRIKAPREMGKTSLLIRIVDHAREQGYQAVIINFQRADRNVLTDLNLLLHWICAQVGQCLRKAEELEHYWTLDRGCKEKCNMYFEECLLQNLDTPLVLGLDEVDLVFSHTATAEAFFSLLRYWYDSARLGYGPYELWETLRLVMAYSTEAYLLLSNEKLSMTLDPTFTVGTNVKLTDFRLEQIQDLAKRHGLSGSASYAEELMTLVGGHPHLIRKALFYLYNNNLTIDTFAKTAATEGGIYSEHLLRHLYFLRDYPNLAEEFRKVVTKDKGKPVEIGAEASFKLESMGLIHLDGNLASPRCEIYRQYFREHLEG